jgi:hypothetical protein
MNTQTQKPAVEVKATVTSVTPVTPGPAQAPSVAAVEATKPMALAIVGGEQVEIPTEVAKVMKSVGVNGTRALMTAKDALCLAGGITKAQAKGMKLSKVKELVGKDKSKTILAEYNRSKVAFHIWSSKVSLLAAGDSSMRKSIRVVLGKGGVFLGTDTKARFTAQADTGLSLENAELKAELAAMREQLKALPAPAAA